MGDSGTFGNATSIVSNGGRAGMYGIVTSFFGQPHSLVEFAREVREYARRCVKITSTDENGRCRWHVECAAKLLVPHLPPGQSKVVDELRRSSLSMDGRFRKSMDESALVDGAVLFLRGRLKLIWLKLLWQGKPCTQVVPNQGGPTLPGGHMILPGVIHVVPHV